MCSDKGSPAILRMIAVVSAETSATSEKYQLLMEKARSGVYSFRKKRDRDRNRRKSQGEENTFLNGKNWW